MSYCRFSTDDCSCDLYAYADVDGGYTIHVATNRYVGAIPKIDWEGYQAERIDDWAFGRQLAEQIDDLRERARVPIGGPADGETYREPDLAAFEARLLALRSAGYRVPNDVFTEIEAERADG